MNTIITLVPDADSFRQAVSIAEKNPKAKVRCLCHEFLPKDGSLPENLVVSSKRDFPDLLSGKEIEEIYAAAVDFSRNWFRHSPEFEEGISHRGISFGFVSEHAFFYTFKEILLPLKAAMNIAKGEKVSKVFSKENSFLCETGKALSKKIGAEFAAMESGPEKAVDRWQNFNPRKFSETVGKLAGLVRGKASGGRGKKTVFFRGRGYLGNLFEEIEKDSKLQPFSLDDFLAKKLANPVAFMAFLRARSRKRKFFSGLYRQYSGNSAFKGSLSLEGIDFSKAFIPRLSRFTERDWPEFVFLVDVLFKEFGRQKPALLVLWEDFVPFERISALVAKQLGVKSLVVQHGLFKPVLPEGNWISGYAPLTADYIAVWSRLAKDHLVNHSVEQNKVFVTGCPKFDAVHNRQFDRQAFRSGLGIEKGEKLVVFAAEGLEFDSNTIGRIIGWLNQGLPGTKKRFVVKIRKIEDIGRWNREIGDKAIVLQDVDLYGLLDASDAVVGKLSSVGLEGMVFGKPFVIFEQKKHFRSAYESDAVFRAGNRPQIVEAFSTVFDEKEEAAISKRIQGFVEEIAFKVDGKSGQRIVELAGKIALGEIE